MPKGETYIRYHEGLGTVANRYVYTANTQTFSKNASGQWVDIYEEYGMSLEDTALSTLMTPAANKERAKNRSRLRHGEEIAGTLERKDSREITLPFHISAPTKAKCLAYYDKLCNILEHGTIDIMTVYQPGVVYRCKYENCQSFSEFMLEMMKFTLRLEEPNPNNRAL